MNWKEKVFHVSIPPAVLACSKTRLMLLLVFLCVCLSLQAIGKMLDKDSEIMIDKLQHFNCCLHYSANS